MTPKKFIFLNLFLAIALFSCEKDETPLKTFDNFITQPATNITSKTASLNGVLIVGDIKMQNCGFHYMKASDQFPKEYIVVDLGVFNTDGPISYNLEDLEPNTTYNFKTFMESKHGNPIGCEFSFTTAAE